MKQNLTTIVFCTLSVVIVNFIGCSNSTTTPDNNNNVSLSGTLLYDVNSQDHNVATYNFTTKQQTIIFKPGYCPSWSTGGDLLYEQPGEVNPVSSWKIVTISSNGTNKQVLLDSKINTSHVSNSPKISKDGSMICFNYWLGGTANSPDIYTGHGTILMKTDGTLIGGIDSLFDGSWMPDGSLVLSATIDEVYSVKTFYQDGLYLLSADGMQLKMIGNGLVNPKHPAASPDGKRIAFSMNSHIWVINADGTGLRQVTTSSKTETHPCWSPDGQYIACICNGTFGTVSSSSLATVPSSNTSPIDLVDNSTYWVIDASQTANSTNGRVNPYLSISWK